jgi:hypothetical protein
MLMINSMFVPVRSAFFNSVRLASCAEALNIEQSVMIANSETRFGTKNIAFSPRCIMRRSLTNECYLVNKGRGVVDGSFGTARPV